MLLNRHRQALRIALAPALLALASTPVMAGPAAAHHDGTPGAGPHAIHYGAGCDANSLPANDDSSTDFVQLAPADASAADSVPFPGGLAFFGTPYQGLWINNNGNVTFDRPLSAYTPFPLADPQVTEPMIAPFFGDVDTRDADSDVVRYGMTTFQGRPAFCVLWAGVGVGYYSHGTDRLNEFQLLLVDRSDRGLGDFDIVFNYDKVEWEAGDASGGTGGLGGTAARAGFTNGAGTALELVGSGENGAFLDSTVSTGLIHNSAGLGLADAQLGRYVFPVENGAPPPPGAVAGDLTSSAGAVADATVSVCGGDDPATSEVETSCRVTVSNTAGRYAVSGLPAGAYAVAVSPPGELLPAQQPVDVGDGTTEADFVLEAPTPPPSGTTVGERDAVSGTPVVIVGTPFSVSAPCADPDGSGTVTFFQHGVPLTVTHNGTSTSLVPLTNDGVGHVRADGIVLATTGAAQAVLDLTRCGGGTSEFDIYIDPSGRILDRLTGQPVAEATVTLFRSDVVDGPFTQVPDGSSIMSPSNRQNPMLSHADGYYGWLTVPGFYVVRVAVPDGCTAPPGSPSSEYIESAVLPVPPEQTDIDLLLDCAQNQPPTMDPLHDVVVDATGPDGAAVVLPEATGTDLEDGTLTGTCTHSVGRLPIGTHTVTCTVEDSGGLTDSGTLTVTVRGAAEQIVALRAKVVGFQLEPRGAQNSITSKLDTASAALAAGRTPSACGALNATLNHVAAQRGKKLTAAQAEEVTADVTRIRAVLACSDR